jgi:hypothetical protein
VLYLEVMTEPYEKPKRSIRRENACREFVLGINFSREDYVCLNGEKVQCWQNHDIENRLVGGSTVIAFTLLEEKETKLPASD